MAPRRDREIEAVEGRRPIRRVAQPHGAKVETVVAWGRRARREGADRRRAVGQGEQPPRRRHHLAPALHRAGQRRHRLEAGKGGKGEGRHQWRRQRARRDRAGRQQRRAPHRQPGAQADRRLGEGAVKRRPALGVGEPVAERVQCREPPPDRAGGPQVGAALKEIGHRHTQRRTMRHRLRTRPLRGPTRQAGHHAAGGDEQRADDESGRRVQRGEQRHHQHPAGQRHHDGGAPRRR
ncbi:hypothetical protein ACFSKM_22985 [Ancylobacter dichloromethanicus]